jgi:hypothetical protein
MLTELASCLLKENYSVLGFVLALGVLYLAVVA